MNHWAGAGLMLVQRLRRWPNIKSASVEWLIFAVFFKITVVCAAHSREIGSNTYVGERMGEFLNVIRLKYADSH